MNKVKGKRALLKIIIVGIFVISGLLCIVLGPLIINCIVSSELEFKATSQLFKLWRHSPFPITTNFYFFNWTNPEDILKPGVKPKFSECGPYSYQTIVDKKNVIWNENGTVTYNQMFRWFLDENTPYPVTDRITSINPIALSSAQVTRHWNYFLRKGLSFTLSASTPKMHTTRTVDELLFEGYEDLLIDIAQKLPMLSTMPRMNRFGWFRSKNGSVSYDGVFNMGTGLKGTEIGRLYNWNYEPIIPFLSGECSKIRSLTGQMTQKDPKDSYYIFLGDFCKDIAFDYVRDEVVSNVLGRKYAVSERAFDNGTLYPENSCNCNGECLPSGVANASACRWGTPSFGSLPHFLGADPYYINSIEGLKPDSEKHQFEMILEPTLGLPLKYSARFQLNLLLQPHPGITLFENVPKVMIPVLWAEQILKIPSFNMFMLNIVLNISLICLIIGASIISLSIIWLFYYFRRLRLDSLALKRFQEYLEQTEPLTYALEKL